MIINFYPSGFSNLAVWRFADLHENQLSDMLVFEAEHVDKGPIATVKLPLRLRNQVHGNWVAAEERQ